MGVSSRGGASSLGGVSSRGGVSSWARVASRCGRETSSIRSRLLMALPWIPMPPSEMPSTRTTASGSRRTRCGSRPAARSVSPRTPVTISAVSALISLRHEAGTVTRTR
ncbi:hypothetical protein FM21_05705 [Streptomyces mutabilis]|uniref:Uncharacterized protein n=1 Tax=Streptomyces mutabilis TaxID=67332 RepID=A0A086N3A7_9ACTN|nr:hypothetical protein FM21_05705 [Streptomyces mutabilis]